MNIRLITNSEIDQRQQELRNAGWQARRSLTITGIRQIFGSTFIAMGTGIYGCMEQRDASEEVIVRPTAATARGI